MDDKRLEEFAHALTHKTEQLDYSRETRGLTRVFGGWSWAG